MRVLGVMCFVSRIWAPAMVLVLMLVGCGGDGTFKPLGGATCSLVFTREDGSEVKFSADSEAFVWCGPWEHDQVTAPTLHVVFGSQTQERYWTLRAVIGDIEIGDTLRFPNYFTWDQPDSVHLFLLDPPNELATDTEESGGFIVFHNMPCPDNTTIDFSIDAVMGSEYGDMPPVTVRGQFTAQVTGPPTTVARPLPAGRSTSTKVLP